MKRNICNFDGSVLKYGKNKRSFEDLFLVVRTRVDLKSKVIDKYHLSDVILTIVSIAFTLNVKWTV